MSRAKYSQEEKDYWWKVLGGLSGREAQIIILRLFHSMTWRQMGENFGVNPERCRQIYMKSLRKLHSQRHLASQYYKLRDIINERGL